MECVRAHDQRRTDEVRDVQVALLGERWPDANALVGELHGQRVAIGLGEPDHGSDAQLPTSALDAQRDLAPVGDQDFFEHAALRITRIVALWSSTRRALPGSLRPSPA